MNGAPVFEQIKAKDVISRVSVSSMPFQWSLNPYRGCTHGCSFCYARATHSYLGMAPDDTFQKHILVKGNAAEALERQLERHAKKYHYDLREMADNIGLIAVGTATDPYQPIEAKAQITRECLKVLARYQVPVTITTRSPLILRDLDLLKQVNVRSVNVSVNTVNRRIWRNMEPTSPSPTKRLEAIQKLVGAGFNAGILLAPILPFLTDQVDELDSVLKAAKQHDAQFVSPSILYLSPDVKAWFMKAVANHYPHLENRYRQLFGNHIYAPRHYTDIVMKRVKLQMAKYGLSEHSRYEPPCTVVMHSPGTTAPDRSRVEQLTLPL